MENESVKARPPIEEVDNYLDYLHNKNIHCPYCRGKIRKFTTVCPRCGVTKRQIYDASNLRAQQIMREKTGEKIFLSRRKPNDVSFTAMSWRLVFGLFGTHRFYVGRRISGWFMLTCALVSLVCFAFVPNSWRDYFNSIILFGEHGLFFPTDFMLVIAFAMWAYDTIAVVMNFFAYPIRLGEVTSTHKAQKEFNRKIKDAKNGDGAEPKK